MIFLSRSLAEPDWIDNFVENIAFFDESNLSLISVIVLFNMKTDTSCIASVAVNTLQSIILVQLLKCLDLDLQLEQFTFSSAQYDGTTFLRNNRLHSQQTQQKSTEAIEEIQSELPRFTKSIHLYYLKWI